MATTPLAADPPRHLGDVLVRAVRAWDRFWFTPADPTTLGLIRICVGLVTLYVHLAYTPDLQELFGKDAWLGQDAINELRTHVPVYPPASTFTQKPPEELPLPPDEAEARRIQKYRQTWDGVDPRQAPAMGYQICSWWYYLTDPTWMMIVHCVVLVVMLLFTLGFCTRVTAALTWLAALNYIQRAPTTLFGLDTMMNISLLYLMIGPSGAALSVDRLIGRWWQRRRAERAGKPVPEWLPPAPLRSANFAIRLLQVHFCVIYLASGLSKLMGSMWWAGTALWFTMANYEFAPLNWPDYESFLVFLCHHRWLWELVVSGGVAYTLALEIGFPFLVWRPGMRWIMIIGAVALHLGISLSMGLTTFGLMMLAMLLSFVPPPAVRKLVNLLPLARPPAEPVPALAA
jgi:hypothetical protein